MPTSCPQGTPTQVVATVGGCAESEHVEEGLGVTPVSPGPPPLLVSSEAGDGTKAQAGLTPALQLSKGFATLGPHLAKGWGYVCLELNLGLLHPSPQVIDCFVIKKIQVTEPEQKYSGEGVGLILADLGSIPANLGLITGIPYVLPSTTRSDF